MRKAIVLIFAFALLFVAPHAFAQTAPAPQTPPSWDQVAQQTWTGVLDKIITMAKDFPEDKFTFKIHPETRSFPEELQHVAGMLLGGIEVLKGNRPNMQEINAGLPKDKAGLVAVLEKAKADYLSAWQADKRPNIIRTTEAMGEHYGKLVQLYRANNLVPPASRR